MKSKRVLIGVVVFLLSWVVSVMAENGSGGGKTAPLALLSSSVSNGEQGVQLDREFKLVFSKNISNITVKEGNLSCFSMRDSKGGHIPLKVILFDDQLERDKRNDVILKPTNLRDGKQYMITVRKELRSKNGATLGKDLEIRFSTLGYKSDSEHGRFPVVLIVPIVFLFISIAYFMNQKK